jgi:acrylyl-CoA reductase (NADPH)
MSFNSFPCFLVRRDKQGHVTAEVEPTSIDRLPAGKVLIEVEYSSLNYKDALAARGHPGVVRQFPHVPGIDCAGVVVDSTTAQCAIGSRVLVTGYDLGSGCWGGYARYVRVPADWVVPLPADVSTAEAMTYGTAGFTAAQSVDALQRHDITPDRGEVVVTGATGGVGSLSIALLKKLGYRVVAITGKGDRPDEAARLMALGATRILPRDTLRDDSERPLLSAQWAGAIDTVGGAALATLVRQAQYRGCVCACGLAGGDALPLTVYPFILRGVTLCGIDSAKCPREPRLEVWRKLFGPWKLPPEALAHRVVTLEELPHEIERTLAGESSGRVLVTSVALENVPQSKT